MGISEAQRQENHALFEQGLKRCPQCDTVKRHADFNKHKYKWDGFYAWCRECEREYRAGIERACSIPGCEKTARNNAAGSMCKMHYERTRKHGDAGPVESLIGTDDITYCGAHDRVKYARGKASEYDCVHCGGKAAEWAYTRTCPRERWELKELPSGSKREVPYSPDPDRYIPLCRPCHIKFDREHAASRRELVSA